MALVAALVAAPAAGTLFAAPSASAQSLQTPRVVAYFVAWGVYGRNYHVSDIPADKITHINYAFANISNGECVLGDPYADIDKYYPGDSWDAGALRGNFNQLNKLKAEHPHLKTLISVGGWTWSKYFSDVALTETSRKKFVTSCIDFMSRYGFDGIDIDWEYPGGGGLAGNISRPEDKQNYTLLMREFRRGLDALEAQDGGDYLLSIAAPAGYDKAAYLEIAELAATLDWINIMTYDFHGSWDPATNHQSALFNPAANPADGRYTTDSATQLYLNAGTPPDKLVIGLPFYGRGWGCVGSADNGLYQPSGCALQGTWEPGNFDYKDLAANYIGAGWTRHWDSAAMVPWLYKPDGGFITYEDNESIGHKTDYVLTNALGGVMFWELSGDNGELLGAINDRFGGGTTPTSSSTTSSTSSTSTTNTTPEPTVTSTTSTTSSTTSMPSPTTTLPTSGGAEFTVALTVTSDWSAGYCADAVVTNIGDAAGQWEVTATIDGAVSSLWSGQWAQSGSQLTVSGLSWNASLAAGAGTTFGFCATRDALPPGSSTTTTSTTTSTTSTTSEPPAPSTTSTTLPPPPLPAIDRFAPYADVMLWPPIDLATTASESRVEAFTLAFIQSDGTCAPHWGGITALADDHMGPEIDALRAAGGDVILSFGGAAGITLAEACTDVRELAAAYRSVIEQYDVYRLDFDIEGAAVEATASIERRSAAIAMVQQDLASQGRKLEITLTLPVLPTGLVPSGIAVVESALNAGVDLSIVNIMAMNYGDSAAPGPDGQMGRYSINAAVSLHGQLAAIYPDLDDLSLWSMVGITPMIGQNDVTSEVLTVAEAGEVAAFAEQRGFGRLSMWSVHRDQPCAGGPSPWASPTCSGIDAAKWAFAGVLSGNTPAPPPPSTTTTSTTSTTAAPVTTTTLAPPPPPPPGDGLATTLAITSDWGSGYCADVDVTNNGSQSVEWQVSVTIDGSVSSLWNGAWSQTGPTLEVSGVSWNAALAAGASTRFGFCATR